MRVKLQQEKELLEDAKRNAYRAAQVGQETVEELERQGETLDKTLDTLEANEYILHKSMRTLR